MPGIEGGPHAIEPDAGNKPDRKLMFDDRISAFNSSIIFSSSSLVELILQYARPNCANVASVDASQRSIIAAAGSRLGIPLWIFIEPSQFLCFNLNV
jgi:hypothetical protein